MCPLAIKTGFFAPMEYTSLKCNVHLLKQLFIFKDKDLPVAYSQVYEKSCDLKKN